MVCAVAILFCVASELKGRCLVELLLKDAEQLSGMSLLANPSQEAGAKVAKVPEEVLNAVANSSMDSWTHPPSKRLELTTVLASRNAQLKIRSIKDTHRGRSGCMGTSEDGRVARWKAGRVTSRVGAQNRFCPSAVHFGLFGHHVVSFCIDCVTAPELAHAHPSAKLEHTATGLQAPAVVYGAYLHCLQLLLDWCCASCLSLLLLLDQPEMSLRWPCVLPLCTRPTNPLQHVHIIASRN